MKITLLLLLLLTGCQTVTWEGKCGKIERSAFGSDLSATHTTIKIGADCSHEISVEGLSDLQSKTLEAVAKGAAEGAAKGLKP